MSSHVLPCGLTTAFSVNVKKFLSHPLASIGLPAAWVDGFEAALQASEAAMDQLMKARGDKSAHVGMGRDAETAWVDGMVRLRRQLASRAKRGDTAKQIENKQLLEPLLVGAPPHARKAPSQMNLLANPS